MEKYYMEESTVEDFGDDDISDEVLASWDSIAETKIAEKFQVEVSWENCHTHRCSNDFMDDDLRFAVDAFVEDSSMTWLEEAMNEQEAQQ